MANLPNPLSVENKIDVRAKLVSIAEKYRPIYERQAKENQSKAGKEYGNGSFKLTANLPQASTNINKERNPTTDKKLSDIAGVSGKTYSMGKKILDSDNETLKQEVLSGEKSINAGYKELTQNKKEEKADTNEEINNVLSTTTT